MAKWYLDSICEGIVKHGQTERERRHKQFLKNNARTLRKIELQKNLCRKLSKEGKKEEAKRLFTAIKEAEKELYCKSLA